ncbi:MAG: c-type cytochrome [Stellaceae bacterium]
MSREIPRKTQKVSAAFAVCLLLAVTRSASGAAAESGIIARGAYLANAADCVSCHTDKEHHGRPYAGGRAIPTPFGTFYSPNITPDRETGIGRWTDVQFLRALHDGVRPDGSNLYPAFPYPSFTRITDADALAIKAYLFSLPPVRHRDRPPALPFPLFWRWLVTPWKWLFFTPGRFRPVPGRGAQWNRGAYLVTALAHCGECHTPRDFLGAMEQSRFLAGSSACPCGKGAVPNITPDRKTGIGTWSIDDITTLLATGQTPDFDFVGGAMAEVVNSTARLTADDRRAIAVFLKSVKPIVTPEQKK